MEEKDYNAKIAQAENDYKKALHKIYAEFALSNAKFKIGDTIADSSKTIVVQKITTNKFIGLPCAVYHGVELKKDLKPKKNSPINVIFGDSRVVTLIKAAE